MTSATQKKMKDHVKTVPMKVRMLSGILTKTKACVRSLGTRAVVEMEIGL
jgi:hypothetical protein